MTDKERLIELLDDKQYHGNSTKSRVNYIQNSELADYLIEHGITVLPRKDAKRSNAIIYYLTREEAEKALKESADNV